MLALAIGLASVTLRMVRLGEPMDQAGINRVLSADNWWGIAALLWIGSGLSRLFWLEKSTTFYTHNGFFWVKMSLFLLIMSLELWPMVAFIKWRVQLGQKKMPDTSRALTFRRICQLEIALVCVTVFTAALMARGAWLF